MFLIVFMKIIIIPIMCSSFFLIYALFFIYIGSPFESGEISQTEWFVFYLTIKPFGKCIDRIEIVYTAKFGKDMSGVFYDRHNIPMMGIFFNKRYDNDF